MNITSDTRVHFLLFSKLIRITRDRIYNSTTNLLFATVALAFIELIMPTSASAQYCSPVPITFRIVSIQNGEALVQRHTDDQTVTIELSNITIDERAARQINCHVYNSEPDVKLILIENEAADLISLEDEDPKYIAAYMKTDRYRRRISGNTEPNGPTLGNSAINSIMQLINTNWHLIAGGLGIPAVLYFIISWFRAMLHARHLSVILLGRPATGKSSLSAALQNNSNPNKIFNMKPSDALSVAKLRQASDSSGRYQFFPEVVDSAGGKPSAIMRHLHPQKIPFTNRLNPKVLVVVAAPNSRDKVKGQEIYDSDFISRQAEYVRVCADFIEERSGIQNFSCIALFANKTDLITDGRATPAQEKEILSQFGELLDTLEAWGQREGIPVIAVAGSAAAGTGVRDFKDQIIDAVAGE